MSYTIKKQEGLDESYHGYHSEYVIDFKFEKQTANVSIEIWRDRTNKVRLRSNTDGYHWLQFFLCQEPNSSKLLELGFNEEVERCQKAFSSINIEYEQEGKDTAWLTIDGIIDEDMVKSIADIIEPRFANRERFF